MCGIPQWALVVPVYMAPTVEYPTGVGSAWIKGTVLDELEWAMARVGAPEGPPEDGALIQITLRQVTSMGVDRVPANTAYHVDYRRPRDPFTERVAASINIERATVSEGSLECHSGQPLHFPAPLGGFEILPDPRPLTGYEQLKMTWRLTTAWRANNFDVF